MDLYEGLLIVFTLVLVGIGAFIFRMWQALPEQIQASVDRNAKGRFGDGEGQIDRRVLADFRARYDAATSLAAKTRVLDDFELELAQVKSILTKPRFD